MKALLLLAAYVTCTSGWACVALSMEPHWTQVIGPARRPGRWPWRLRALGATGLLASLLLCLNADRASMAALVWILMLTAGAWTVALALAWHSHGRMPERSGQRSS